jgi:hypothetical protein
MAIWGRGGRAVYFDRCNLLFAFVVRVRNFSALPFLKCGMARAFCCLLVPAMGSVAHEKIIRPRPRSPLLPDEFFNFFGKITTISNHNGFVMIMKGGGSGIENMRLLFLYSIRCELFNRDHHFRDILR